MWYYKRDINKIHITYKEKGDLVMILEVTKRFPTVEEPITVKFEVYDTALESRYLDSRDWTYYGYSSLQELEDNMDNNLSLRILQELYHSTRLLSGGRLDVLLRTPVRVLRLMSELNFTEDTGVTVLQIAYNELKELNVDDFEFLEEFKSVDEAVEFIKRRDDDIEF